MYPPNDNVTVMIVEDITKTTGTSLIKMIVQISLSARPCSAPQLTEKQLIQGSDVVQQ